MHKTTGNITLDNLRSIVGKRNLYVWGAGNQGRGIARVLSENGIAPSGFIDNSPTMHGKVVSGIKVQNPEIISGQFQDNNFILIAVYFYENEISDICRSLGLHQGVDFIHYSALKPRDYAIDISGSCNLRCISCPRASKNKDNPYAGFMSLDNFKSVVEKIKREDPFVGNIQLYQWGEPTLNKYLPAMIEYAREQGILCAISSNLNNNINYRSIIAARPEWFRFSASGWGNSYEITHTGARWELFVQNLKHISALRKEFYPEMKVELYYHLYKHSTGAALRNFRDLCGELTIEFHPVYAYLISLDDVLRFQEGLPLPDSAKQARDLMLLDIEEGLEIAQSESTLPCDAFRSILINADLSVSNCMMFYYPEDNRAVENFLDNDANTITTIRRNCNLCKRCMKFGIHRYCGAYSKYQPDIERLIGND